MAQRALINKLICLFVIRVFVRSFSNILGKIERFSFFFLLSAARYIIITDWIAFSKLIFKSVSRRWMSFDTKLMEHSPRVCTGKSYFNHMGQYMNFIKRRSHCNRFHLSFASIGRNFQQCSSHWRYYNGVSYSRASNLRAQISKQLSIRCIFDFIVEQHRINIRISDSGDSPVVVTRVRDKRHSWILVFNGRQSQ